MAWLKIESSVARNRKFLKAGPAASWLWICGIAYCQEGLTDGFIPREALPALGVLKDADRLATKLVIAGLWDACEEGGWRVHDYLEHNRSASEVSAIRAARAAGGKHGGRPRNKPSEKPSTHSEGLTDKTLRKTSAVDVDASVAVAVADDEDGQAAFMRFQAAYPGNRTGGGRLVLESFLHQMRMAGGSARLFAALENHRASEQWSNPKHIPNMDVWLEKERWRQALPPASADEPALKRPWEPLSVSLERIAKGSRS